MRWVGLSLLMLGSCVSQEATVLESTTKEIPVGGGRARSADGLLEVVVPADALAASLVIDIETLATPGPGRAVSRVYEVRLSELALRPAATLTVRYDAASVEYPRPLAIARWPSGGDPVPLSGNEAQAPATVEGRVSAFQSERFLVVPAPLPPPPAIPDGWDSAAATQRAWIVNRLAIAGRGEGFDLDLQCGADGCKDNDLWQLGELGNDQIRQALLGGESLLALELAGLDVPYVGDDASLTVKFYGVRDMDDPFYPSNNFKVPPGQTECCQFLITPDSLDAAGGQARSRSAGRIEDHRLFSLTPSSFEFLLAFGVPPHPSFRFERLMLDADLPATLTTLTGMFGAVLPMSTLSQISNPYCQSVSPRCPVQFTESSLLDLVSTVLGPVPDIDLDGDGLECVVDRDGDGRVDLCCDGMIGQTCGPSVAGCLGAEIPPVDATPGQEGSCALAPEMADGYSIAFEFGAVPATLHLSR